MKLLFQNKINFKVLQNPSFWNNFLIKSKQIWHYQVKPSMHHICSNSLNPLFQILNLQNLKRKSIWQETWSNSSWQYDQVLLMFKWVEIISKIHLFTLEDLVYCIKKISILEIRARICLKRLKKKFLTLENEVNQYWTMEIFISQIKIQNFRHQKHNDLNSKQNCKTWKV